MTPIPPSAIISLRQAGYPADLVFRLTVHAINGLQNRYGGMARAKSADPGFCRLTELRRQQQMSNTLGMRLAKIDERQASSLIMRGDTDEGIQARTQEIRKLLGLNPEASELRVV